MSPTPLSTLRIGLLSSLLLAFGPLTAEVEEEKAAWDVNNPDFSTDVRVTSFEVNEGTWMSLSVSPDGQHIAFDLLGDIYEIGIDGGAATPLTEGHAWDIQPRYSPDGQSLAFISDRAGGDNIFVLDRKDQTARQITFESFRLLNNPAWSPDGEFIAARKHFTTSRSLGTGEIWLYHTAGTAKNAGGIQVVEKPSPTFQKELGEPIFSADGKSIYYTQNVTPGNMFIYHQDSNKEIFQIKRVELENGKISPAVTGVGGAVRATPSPDGKHIAFVRRVRGDSSLFIKHLETGVETRLVAGLDPDMQETWGVQGLYPNMDWTPDAKTIVYWTGGKIWRVNIDSPEPVQIPFTVKHERSTFEAPSPNIRVAPEQFQTRMVRFASRSPDGKSVAFESLGHIYVKEGDERPRRLTKNKDGFEFYPTWTPDSRQVIYVHWSDEDLAVLKRVGRRSGSSRVLLDEKGHYIEPSVSADGKHLVYRKLEGGSLRHPAHGENPGLYLLDMTTGKTRFLHKNGRDAHFAGEHIYFSDRKRSSGRNSDTAKTRLYVMDINGHDVTDIANTELGTQIRVSPDEKWVAFVEHYQVYVTPLKRTGQSIALAPNGKSLPTVRLSEIGGMYLNWTGNDVSWSLGPDFKTVTADASILADPAEPGSVDLSMTVATAKPSGTVALTNVRVISMDPDDNVIEKGTIVINDNRITAVGATESITVPEGAVVYDGAGKTVIPGIIDAHAHGRYANGDIIPQENWNSLAHLALGVTTQHNPSSSANQAFAAAEYARAGRILSSRIYSTGEIVYGAKGLRFAPVESIDDALAHIKRLKAQGAISIKNYNQPRREQRQQVIEAARQENLAVVAEGGSLYHMDMSLVVDGSTGIEHNVPALNLYEDVLRLWESTNVGYTPTLVVTYGGLTSEDYYYAKSNVWEHPLLSRFVPPEVLQPRSVRRVTAPESDFRDDDAAAAAKKLMERGVVVNIGAHGQREGLASHWEMWSFVRGGMSPLQALATATINPALYLGMDEDLGSIETGKLADLVILDANPLDDIEHSDNISHVMINGRLFNAGTLAEELTGTRPAPSFWWHE